MNGHAVVLYYLASIGILGVAGCHAHDRAERAETRVPGEFTNSIGMQLRRLEPGEFLMGTQPALKAQKDTTHGGYRYEPPHKVKVEKPVYIGIHEVTNKQYREFNPKHRSGVAHHDEQELSLDGEEQPVTNVSWEQAVQFCKWLSEKERRTYRLPSENEWEYACRAGRDTGKIPDEEEAANYAWTPQNSGWVTHPVGTKKANNWGLYDMIGNVWEMCEDWIAPYPGTPENLRGAEHWPKPTSRRVMRGGSLYAYAHCGARSSIAPDEAAVGVGFRVVCESVVVQED